MLPNAVPLRKRGKRKTWRLMRARVRMKKSMDKA